MKNAFYKALITSLLVFPMMGNLMAQEADDGPAMPIEEVAIVQIDAINNRDFELVKMAYNAEIKLFQFPDKLQGTGMEGIKAYWDKIYALYPQFHLEPELINPVGNRLVVNCMAEGVKEGERTKFVMILESTKGKMSAMYIIQE